MNDRMLGDGEQDGGGENILTQLPSILRHRKWLVIIPLLLGAAAAVAALLLLPTLYRSSAVILVQSSKLSGDIVGSAVPDSVDRRLARIQEQITSRPDLLALIDAHGLYAAERGRMPLSQVVDKMRSAIQLTPATANVAGDASNDRTISFALSFDYTRPVEAQAVTQDLMTKILELDASQTSKQATDTVQFLSDQMSELQSQIAEVEGRIAAISASNGRALSGGMPIMNNSASADMQISQLQRENASLQAQRQSLSSADDRDPAVVATEAQLAAARAVYSDNHPDVAVARQRAEEARVQARGRPRQAVTQQIDQQIAFNNSQIAALRSAKGRELAQVASTLDAQARGPLAEQQIAQLQQRLTALNDQMKGVSGRLLAAKAGVRADDEQMGQRLSVVEPPVIPDTPHSPNRLIVGGIGIGGGLVLGLMLALAAEMLMRPIRSPEALVSIFGEAPLAAIPVISGKGSGLRTDSRELGLFARIFRRRGRAAIGST
jgi:uncharacterized protein involved in exopolysaccharide biosynthesis